MTILKDENFSSVMADREDQRALLRERSKPYVERKVRRAEFHGPDDGWYVLDDTRKREIKLARDKPQAEQFEDRLWVLLSRLGFKYISRDRSCRLQYDQGAGSTQQLDVLAVDDECAVIIECKSAEGTAPKAGNFKTEIESLAGKKAGLHREIRERFGNPKLKIAYVLATQNYTLKRADLERLDSFQIHHFGEADLEYYSELADHLGAAARYQFEANLFKGQDIPSIDGRVFAIEGTMGGMRYYSFSIEPDRLLKLGFVLHRSKSIRTLPTYQRLIKRTRLTAIRKFINNGGYFPNSIVVNIESGGKNLRFEQSSSSLQNDNSRLGVLHLPTRYQSAYVVDGQHRLYAYSGSQYGSNNSIPVVAFVDLERSEQLRLFMEINENQKAVSKNLKHTLDADLKWDSPNLNERADGVKKQLAQELGENITSPLYNRVLVGEDQRSETRVITLEAILRGINQTRFVGKFTKDTTRENGLFNSGKSEDTLDRIFAVLSSLFGYFMEEYPDEWARLPKDGAILTVNDGVTAAIALFGDVVDHMVRSEEISPLQDSPEKIIDTASTYLDGLKAFFAELSPAERADLRSKYGSGAPTRLRRIFQRAIHEHRIDFDPVGLQEYWRDQSKQYNTDTFSRIADIELHLRSVVKESLMGLHGNMWLKKGIPEKLYTHLITEAAKKNRTIEKDEDEKTPWDCLNLIHIREIALHGSQWSNLFQKVLTIPGEEGRRKEDRTGWLVKLNGIRNNAAHEYSVGKADADYVSALHDWLILGSASQISGYAGTSDSESGGEP